jgi:hypothetical protein
MQLTPTSKPLLYTVQIPVHGDLALDSLPYEPLTFAPSGFDLRSTLRNFDSCNPTLTAIIEQITNSQYLLLAQLWQNPRYSQHIWGSTCTLAQLESIVSPYIEISQDQPGYYCDRHVDNLRAITTGMIFFNAKHDHRSSTKFYAKQHSLRSITMPSGMGQGWFTANWHDCWHSGANRTSIVRYSIKFGLHLTL